MRTTGGTHRPMRQSSVGHRRYATACTCWESWTVRDKSESAVQTLRRFARQHAIDETGTPQLEQNERGSYSTQTPTNWEKWIFLKKGKGNHMDLELQISIRDFLPDKLDRFQSGNFYVKEAPRSIWLIIVKVSKIIKKMSKTGTLVIVISPGN